MTRSDDANALDSAPGEDATTSPAPTQSEGSIPAASADTDVSSTVYLVPSELLQDTPPPVVPPIPPAVAPTPPPLPPAARPSHWPPLAKGKAALASHFALPAPAAPAKEADTSSLDQILADARRRLSLVPKTDKARLARAHLEFGLLLEIRKNDPAAALDQYQLAEKAQAGLLPAIAAVRRLMPQKPLSPVLAQVEAEARACTHPGRRAAKLLELARLQGTGGPLLAERACQTYREVLDLFPRHPGALRGLETALRQVPSTLEAGEGLASLAAHLETMANHFRGDPSLAAWLQIERGHCLERLRQLPAAAVAFETALEIEGKLGPVRTAYAEHLAREGQFEALAKAWAAEADLETDPERAARLFYMAGRLCSERLDQTSQAIAMHERAQGLGAAAPFTRQAALRELVDLYDDQPPAQLATMQAMLAIAPLAEQPYWHRRLAKGFQSLGKHTEVALHAQAALDHAPDDEALLALLDHALATLGKHAERVALFTGLSERTDVPGLRVEHLLRASRVAELDLSDTELALVALRAALAIDPGHCDTLDALARLLVSATPPPSPTPGDPSNVRARIDFLSEAAAAIHDPPRKVAHLESLARIWEDELRDPGKAAAVWEEILAIEPRRRGAMIGLARTAARAGKVPLLIHALGLEAKETKDAALERSLRLRAAALAFERLNDPAKALELLDQAPHDQTADGVALRLRFRALEKTEQYGEALAALQQLLDLHRKDGTAFDLQIEVAHFLEEKLRKPAEALAAFREAHALSPENPLPREEMRRLYLAQNNHTGLANEFAKLAKATADPAIKLDLLFQAAQIFDDRLGDADQAIPLLVEARAVSPDEPLIFDRLEQAYLRKGRSAERLALLDTRKSPGPAARFQVACLLSEGRDAAKAYKRLATLTRDETVGVAALRTLEHTLHQSERWDDLAVVLRKQVEVFATHEAQLGSLHEIVALEEFQDAAVMEGHDRAITALATRDPGDLFIHELTLRRAGLGTPAEESGPGPVVSALRALASTEEPLASAYFHLACAILLERSAARDQAMEALRNYRAALAAWPESLAAGRALRRLALAAADREAQLAACAALGEHELDGKARALRLLEAATLSTGNLPKAMDFACRALAQDPNSGQAADAVLAATSHGLDAGQAVELLRKALDLTKSADQAVKLGSALAHVASHYLGDHTVAIEALRRARKRAPTHAGTLLTLAEVSLAMSLATEAMEAASAGLANTHDSAERVRGLITLADVHARKPAFRDMARREANEACQLAEQIDLANAPALARLGTTLFTLGEDEKAAPILVRAAALSTGDRTALDQLLALPAPAEKKARHLTQIIALAAQLGRPPRPEWLSALGHLEATSLGRPQDGMARLREAVRNAPENLELWDALQAAHGEAQGKALTVLLDLLPALGARKPRVDTVAHVLRVLSRALEKSTRPTLVGTCEALIPFLETGARPAATPGPLPPRTLSPDRLRPALLVDAPDPRLLEIATALAEIAPKLTRSPTDSPSLGGRERLAPRSAHPARAMADRVAKAFGDFAFDLYLDLPDLEFPRILSGIPHAILLPSGFLDQPEVDQRAGLARVFALATLDVPFLDHLDDGEATGLLLGALRVGKPQWGRGALPPEIERMAEDFRPRIAKLAPRKLKRGLEDLAQRVSVGSDAARLFDHLRAAGLCAAYLASGELTAALALAIRDPRLGLSAEALAPGLFAHPVLLTLLRLALSEDVHTLRRALDPH